MKESLVENQSAIDTLIPTSTSPKTGEGEKYNTWDKTTSITACSFLTSALLTSALLILLFRSSFSVLRSSFYSSTVSRNCGAFLALAACSNP